MTALGTKIIPANANAIAQRAMGLKSIVHEASSTSKRQICAPVALSIHRDCTHDIIERARQASVVNQTVMEVSRLRYVIVAIAAISGRLPKMTIWKSAFASYPRIVFHIGRNSWI